MLLLGFVLGTAFTGAAVVALFFAWSLGYIRDWRRVRRLTSLRGGKLPPATATQLRRAKHASRADLRTVSLRIVRPHEDD